MSTVKRKWHLLLTRKLYAGKQCLTVTQFFQSATPATTSSPATSAASPLVLLLLPPLVVCSPNKPPDACLSVSTVCNP